MGVDGKSILTCRLQSPTVYIWADFVWRTQHTACLLSKPKLEMAEFEFGQWLILLHWFEC